jgi:hypothetical protein
LQLLVLFACVTVGCCQQPTATQVTKTRSCKYSENAPDDERKYLSKHVEHQGTVNYPTQLHHVGYFVKIVLWCTDPWISNDEDTFLWNVREALTQWYRIRSQNNWIIIHFAAKISNMEGSRPYSKWCNELPLSTHVGRYQLKMTFCGVTNIDFL